LVRADTYRNPSPSSIFNFQISTAIMKLYVSLRTLASVSTLVVATTAFVPPGSVKAPSFSSSSCRSSSLSASDGEFDFDVAIIGCGVGGHGAALHSRGQGLSTAVFSGGDVGGTCVNRGCVPSKALLAASGRVRDMKDTAHLESLGIQVDADNVNYSREGIAAHAKNLANRVKGNLENSLVALGCDVVEGRGMLTANPQEVKDEATGKVYKCKVRY
jgi:dihydrolipoamide dehydrogenase